jgi:branched-chain amino acid transport system ATP-binding protein
MPASAPEPILELKDLTIDFGGVRAVDGINLGLAAGELVGLIGPNGAGKTTVFNLITNAYRPTRGEVRFDGRSTLGLSPDRISRLGISRTFQNIRVFPHMTAYENVELGFHSRPQYSLFECFVRLPRAVRIERENRARASDLLAMVGLDGYAEAKAGSLPYGLQRRLEIARAMATSPRLLLLDEPAAGMNEDECNDLVNLIRTIHRQMHYSIIIIEHHMAVVMELCRDSRIYVLNLGALLASGGPAQIQGDPDVINAYLGERKHGASEPAAQH